MIKKLIASIILITLTAVAIVQAMGNEKEATIEQKQQTVQKKDTLPGLSIGLKAPDFELKTLSGEKVKLSDYKGKKVILNFWATWCPPCKKEMPDMEKYYKEIPEDVVLLSVNIDPQYDVKGFVKKMSITFPILLDENDVVNSTYKVMTIPTTYFINKDGIIHNKYFSAITSEKLMQLVEEM